MALKINKILCPVDLHVERAHVLSYPINLAKAFNAKLQICFCVNELAGTVDKDIHESLNILVIKELDLYVAGDKDPPVNWESIVIESNNVAQGITKEAAVRNTDLIVMRSSRHPFLHAVLGSTAERVCRAAPCPVIVLHSKETSDNAIRKILVGYDFSDYSELALQLSQLLANTFNAELHLINVLNKPVWHEPELAWTDATVSQLYHQTNEKLQKAVADTNNKKLKIRTSVKWGKPYREILDYIKENDIDFVAMGAHGADFGKNSLFGSNIDRVLRQSPGPVLVARPLRPLL
jgi:nucleotide-binding universal stress UspA family protein